MANGSPRTEDAASDLSDARVVLVTAPDPEVGTQLARELVEARVAACVNVLPGVTSVYAWEGTVHEDAEVLLVVKTVAGHLPALEAHLAEHHPYDVPECVALAPAHVEARYLTWLQGATRTSASSATESTSEDAAAGGPAA